MSTYTAIMDRPLRRDAAERRSALLDAAREVFASEGIDAPLDHIADRAGVGRATLYRNFPGRTEMALAVLLDDVEALHARFADDRGPDAFQRFLAALSEQLRADAGLSSVLRAAPSRSILRPLRAALVEASAGPLAASQGAGTVRADLDAFDIRILSAMLAGGLQNAEPEEHALIVRRSLELVLDAVAAR